MRLRIILVLAFLSFLVVPPFTSSAEAPQQELYDFDQLQLKLHLDNSVMVTAQGGTPDVEDMAAILSWYPRESYRQEVAEVATLPAAQLVDDGYKYAWVQPRTNKLDFSLDALVRTTNEPLGVHEEIPFPITTMPAEIAWYTQPGELINLDEDISKQALLLASGKDDLFEVVYSVADWVTTNIAYNLTTMTASASQPSTWVMENREGVCDEMTSLFISMLRSLGIPARFISGVSYTNLPEFAEPWGGHGWAEVWFPGTGWVPFDVTYGTYGYVDATHIKLKESLDAGSSSVDFTMRARNAGLVTKSLGIDVQVREKRRDEHSFFTVTMEPFDEVVSLNSYNLVTATVENNLDQYVSARLQLAQTENIVLLGDNERNILLKPLEKKKLYFILKTEDLAQGFRYEFPIKLYAGFREVAETSFAAREGQSSYNKDFFSAYLEVEQAERAYNEHASLSCVTEPSAAYLGDAIGIQCQLENKGESTLQAVSGCIGASCERLDLAPGENKSFWESVTCETPGVKNILATATNRLISSHALARYECVDEASVLIEELEHPSQLGFDQAGDISFVVKKGSETLPEKVKISVIHDNFEQWWEVEHLLEPQKFTYTIRGANLDLDENAMTLLVTYQDSLGKEYQEERSFTITPENFTFLERLQVHLQNFEQWVEAKVN